MAKSFYTKQLIYRGIAIKAPAVVDDKAVIEARRRLKMMLHMVPDVRANLKSYGAELHIIGKDQATSDLPEYQHLKGKPFEGELTVDQRTRGLGGIQASCGEENLLKLAEDRFFGRDICVHEFAHTIQMFGLDDKTRRKIQAQYKRSLTKGLWKGCYAGKNVEEFFAELCMWYFGTRGDFGSLNPQPGIGSDWLKKYDKQSFKLLKRLFDGKTKVQRVKLKLLKPGNIDQEDHLRSTNGDMITEVNFRNTTDKMVKLFWLDYTGKRVHYANLHAGGSHVQSTFLTHPWVITDENDNAIQIFLPKSRPATAMITD